MNFSLGTYDEGRLEGMVQLYNRLTEFEPHIAPLSVERFRVLVQQKSYFDPAGLFVATEAARVVGWVHGCVAPGSEGRHDPAKSVPQIRMLLYPADRLRVGAALVGEATAWLKNHAQGDLLAMHAKEGYPFYRGLWLGGEPMCPVTLPQAHLALEVAGYENTQESIFMAAGMDSPPDGLRAEVPIELEDAPAQMAHEGMRESWVGFAPRVTRARLGQENVGSVSWVVLPQLAERLSAPCMNIWGLGVRGPHRRKGIASALISHAMMRSYAEGARFCSVGTQLWNDAAHATYAKLAFRPRCILVGRTLKTTTAE